MKYIFIYLVLVNFLAFMAFGLDKNYAKCKKRRIPEKTLFSFAYLGGGIGCLAGMSVFRHKTKHRSFTWGIPAIMILEAAIIVWAILKFF